jgi:small subunit ribosomal protein S1
MTVDVHNPDQTESKPLNTELETLAPEATAVETELSSDSTSTPHAMSSEVGSIAASGQEDAKAGAGDPSQSEPDYDAADFAAALANFDREQAAETAAAQNLTAEEVVIAGTVAKLTDKHVVVDIGLKSEGLIPLEQVLDLEGKPKFKAGDAIEVVVEREEPEGGYLVSY